MKDIYNLQESIGQNYPTTTGRLKQVGREQERSKKVALMGDSTLDNGYWVETNIDYSHRTHNVTHQTAVALAKSTKNADSYQVANFAVDGATTESLLRHCYLSAVVGPDADHPGQEVHQLNAVSAWQPDVAVISVGGNNYREALFNVLQDNLNYFQLLLRITPEHAKPIIKKAFDHVKQHLLAEYKAIIDELIQQHPGISRIVLMSQYFPAITDFTPYFIYTGFSHVARSEGKGQTPFAAVEETMNELYRGILDYVATKNKEVVFADVTSSMNPLGGNHTLQIEPNEQGSKIMGKLIATAVEYDFPAQLLDSQRKPIAVLRMNRDEEISSELLEDQQAIQDFSVKTINDFISENRYRHVGLFFSPSTSLAQRYVRGYELIMGKQFDTEYKGLFAFGLLDLSLVTVMASYLWRFAVDEQIHLSLRIVAGAAAAPVLMAKTIVGLVLMLVLALPILGYHYLAGCFNSNDSQEEELRDESAYCF